MPDHKYGYFLRPRVVNEPNNWLGACSIKNYFLMARRDIGSGFLLFFASDWFVVVLINQNKVLLSFCEKNKKKFFYKAKVNTNALFLYLFG